MDARALLAIVFLLWLIRTWVKWDLQEKKATQSRLRLRDRLADSMLRERVGARQALPVTADVLSGDSSDDSPDPQAVNDLGDRKRHLQDQLAMLEAQALASSQSDLEIRRLRSELQSVQSNEAALSDLEERVSALQHAMNEADPSQSSSIPDELSPIDAPERGDRKVAAPATTVKSDDAGASSSVRTPLFKAPDEKDDLKLIKGIGPVMERTLNDLGVTTFKQLANFDQADIDKVSDAIGAFSGRIERDDWVGKAQSFVRDQNAV
ncbi:MAG: hypothetical protein AB8B97_22470 [Granulosicoccus sp.]